MIKIIHDKPPFEPKKSIGYPMLCVGMEGLVVLFTNTHQGTVVRADDERRYSVGYSSHSWGEHAFKPLPEGESITLTNTWESANA